MHTHEVCINEKLVAGLLKEQFPEYQHISVAPLKHSGTDNAIFRLGERKAIRLPRIPSAAEQLEKEIVWLPKFTSLPVHVPVPIKVGRSNADYPFPWFVYEWVEGQSAFDRALEQPEQTAKDLAGFIRGLQSVSTEGAPQARRGLPLKTQDNAVREAITALETMKIIDAQAITAIWEECLLAPTWDKPAVWLHGDLLPTNILLDKGKLQAVIDFGLCGIGDPACDLLPAWCLLEGEAREVFRQELVLDDATWLRGKGWALSIALIIIPYYIETNPDLTSVAKRMLKQVQHDSVSRS